MATSTKDIGSFSFQSVMDFLHKDKGKLKGRVTDTVKYIQDNQGDIQDGLTGLQGILKSVMSVIRQAEKIRARQNRKVLRGMMRTMETAINLSNQLIQGLNQQDWSGSLGTLENANQQVLLQVALIRSLDRSLVKMDGLLRFSKVRASIIGSVRIRMLLRRYNQIGNLLKSFKELPKPPALDSKAIITLLKSLQDVFTAIPATPILQTVRLKPIALDIKWLQQFLEQVKKIRKVPAPDSRSVVALFNGLQEIFKAVQDTPALGTIRLKLIILDVRWLQNFLNHLKPFPKIPKLDSRSVVEMLTGLQEIFTVIRRIPTAGISVQIRILTGAAGKVGPLVVKIVEITNIKRSAEATKRMDSIKVLVKSFASILTSFILMAPLASAFLLLSPVLILLIWVSTLVVKLLVRFIRKVTGPRTMLAISGLIVVIGLLGLVVMGLLVLALLARPLVKSFVDLVKLMLGLSLFVVLLAGFGLLITVAMPMLVMATLGTALLGVSVLTILAMAGMMLLLTQIKLDRESIEESVANVLWTAKSIIFMAFSPIQNPAEPQKEPPTGLLGLLGNGVANLVGALLGSAILVMTMLSVAALLLIAVMLKEVEKMQLDTDKVRENIRSILDMVRTITSAIFAPDKEATNNSGRGLMGGLLGLIFPPLIPVLDAIFSMAYLTVMIISVGAILLIAKILKKIEELDLDEDGVLDNVQAIIDACRSITTAIFAPDREDTKGSGRGIMGSLISWIFPALTPMLDAIFSMAYLSVMIISVTMVLGIARMLSRIGALDKETFDKAKDNVVVIMETMAYIRECIFGGTEEETKESKRGALMSIIAWVAGEGVASMLEGILLIGNLAMMYFSIYLVAGIAKAMNRIAGIDPANIQKAGENAGIVITTAMSMMNSILNGSYNMPASKDSSALGRLLRVFIPKGLMDIVDLLATMGKLSLIQVAIGAIARIAKDLNDISTIQYNGTTTQAKAEEILTAASTLVGRLMGDFKGIGKRDLRKFKPIMEKLSGTITALKDLTEQMNGLGKLNTTSIKQAVVTAGAAMTGLRSILSSLISNQALSWSELASGKTDLKKIRQILHKQIHPLISDMEFTTKSLTKLTNQMAGLGELDGNAITGAIHHGGLALRGLRGMLMSYSYTGEWEDLAKQIPSDREMYRVVTGMMSDAKGFLQKIRVATDLLGTAPEYSKEQMVLTSNLYKVALQEFRTILEDANKIEVDGDRIGSNMALLERISRTIGGFVKVTDADVENSRKITENYAKFLTTVNKMDYQKLNSTAWMMRYWASISKDLRGDFEGLAKAVSDHIVPMLDTLNRTMDEVTKVQQTIMDELSGPVELKVDAGTTETPDTSTPTPMPASVPPPPTPTNMGSFGSMGTMEDFKTTKKYMVQFAKIEEA